MYAWIVLFIILAIGVYALGRAVVKEAFVGETDIVLSRPIFTAPEDKFRVKARAYSSCECTSLAPITKTKNQNPFVWPYSGSATPYKDMNESMTVRPANARPLSDPTMLDSYFSTMMGLRDTKSSTTDHEELE